MKRTLKINELAGSFAENKDIAKKIRTETILPALERGEEIELDYTDVENTTQSFTHALVSEGIRLYGDKFFDLVAFKKCNKDVQKIIGIVSEYMQRRLDE